MPVLQFAAVVAITIGVSSLLDAARKASATFQLHAKVSALQEQKVRLENEKGVLTEQIEEVSGPQWPELAAREQLGWTRPDEVLVVLRPKPVAPAAQPERKSLPEKVSSRWQEWTEYLRGDRLGAPGTPPPAPP